MSACDYKSRTFGRKAVLRAGIAPLVATMIGLFSLAGVQAATGQNFYDYLEQGYREVATYDYTDAAGTLCPKAKRTSTRSGPSV